MEEENRQLRRRAPHGVVELLDEPPPLHRLRLFLRRQGIHGHTRSRYAKSSSNKAAQLRRACLERDVVVEIGQGKNRAMQDGAAKAALVDEPRLRRKPRLPPRLCSRPVVPVTLRVLDVLMKRPRHRKPRDVLLRATWDITRTSSSGKAEQHKKCAHLCGQPLEALTRALKQLQTVEVPSLRLRRLLLVQVVRGRL